MPERSSKRNRVDLAFERIDGRLHSVRSTLDESGRIIHQTVSPLGVDFRWQDICEVAIGACVLAIPSASTEEVWRLGEQLPWLNVLAILGVSLVFVSLFVYFIFYKEHLRGHVLQFLNRVITGYAITLLVVVAILIMFEKFPWESDPATAIRRAILVGFPACFSATVVDSLK